MNYPAERIESDAVVLLGGSFNPVHCGHLAMAEAAHTEYGAESVILLPNKTTYYKEHDDFAPDRDRLAMLHLAAETSPWLSVSDLEIRRGGVTHTVDTIRYFREKYPERQVYFIMGGDSLAHLLTWVEAKELLETMHILTAVRDEVDSEVSERWIEKCKAVSPDADIRLLKMPPVSISSSEIRRRRRQRLSITGMVPPAVEDYILRHQLYE